MGISYRVVVGFPVTKENVYDTETKYNPDNGEPYEKKVLVGDLLKHDGVVLSDKGEYEPYHYSGDSIEGLELFESGYEDGDLILGAELAVTHDGDGIVSFDTSNVPDAVLQLAKAHGIKPIHALVSSCG